MQRIIPLTYAIPAITIMIVMVSLGLGSIVHAQNADFVLMASPSNLCVNPGVDAVSAISLQSVGGFSGTVNIGGNVDPALSSGPNLSPIPPNETLAAGQTISFDLALSTTPSTPLRVYYVTVSGFSSGTLHQATVQLTVAAGCSVGGTTLPLDRPALLSAYAGAEILTSAALAVLAALLIYRRQTKQRSAQ